MQIFPNGTLKYSNNKQSDIDGHGLPIAATSNSLTEVRCTISTLSEDRKGHYTDGRYRNCQYSITCNLEDVGTEFKDVRILTLTHDIMGTLGSFQVQRIEFYTLTQTVEVWL